MNFNSRRLVILALLALSVGLLIPGLFAPVLTIRGVLKPEGLARLAPELIEKGLDDDTINVLKSMMNPGMLSLLEITGGDLRQTIIAKLTPQITASLQKHTTELEVFEQTRSIAGSVRHLYEVDSPVPATLILLFSVIVPFGKVALVLIAVFQSSAARRQRVLGFVELIAKWSMADVFVVAVIIAYLAAQASQAPPGNPGSAASLVVFKASFGAGFYWFTGYCLFSLASQQFANRWLANAAAPRA